jgi:hypothetical protein
MFPFQRIGQLIRFNKNILFQAPIERVFSSCLGVDCVVDESHTHTQRENKKYKVKKSILLLILFQHNNTHPHSLLIEHSANRVSWTNKRRGTRVRRWRKELFVKNMLLHFVDVKNKM